MAWQTIIDPPASGKENMEKDIKLFRDFEAGLIPPTLRIYSWGKPCVSYGYSQRVGVRDPSATLGTSAGWETVKRPTGGGIVFHNEAEVTYSLVMDKNDPRLPKGLVSAYKVISKAIVCALRKVGVDAKIGTRVSRLRRAQSSRHQGIKEKGEELCFAWPAEYEVVCQGKKIVGSAQKRGRKALLQQGSIFVRNDLQNVLPLQHINAISVEEVLQRKISFKEIAYALVEGFSEIFQL